MRVCVCATQIPHSRGGAELLVESLVRELDRRGFEAELVTVPFSWNPRLQLLKSAFAWRLLQLESVGARPIDLVIATRFPSYLIRHPNKVVWLIHQFRQVYDLLGTEYSDFGSSPEDRAVVKAVRAMDGRALAEARARYTIARNTTDRLRRFNGLTAETLYPPPKLAESLRPGPFGDYVLAVSRLDQLKRLDLLVRAVRHVQSPVRCRIVGTGEERENLEALVARLDLADRVELLGSVDDRTLLDCYASCLAVFYAPYDEDYGFAAVEAFKAGKPVLTASDSGGVLEFVEDAVTGAVCRPGSPRAFARRIDELYRDRERAREMGAAGRRRVEWITWDHVIPTLTGIPG